MRKPDARALIARARDAARFSYSPYSGFPVGAALLCEDGTVVLGTNVENRSFGLANCAERSALFAAVSLGKRTFAAIAVACPLSDVPVSPCGACRQALSELCPADMPVYFTGRGRGARRNHDRRAAASRLASRLEGETAFRDD